MAKECCRFDWMCPVESPEQLKKTQFSDSPSSTFSKVKSSVPLSAKPNTASTTLHEMSTTSPGSGKSAFESLNERTSMVLTIVDSRKKQTELQSIKSAIQQKRRSCTMLSVEVRNRERTYGQALSMATSNFRKLTANYKSQMQELDRIQKAIQKFEEQRRRRQVHNPILAFRSR